AGEPMLAEVSYSVIAVEHEEVQMLRRDLTHQGVWTDQTVAIAAEGKMKAGFGIGCGRRLEGPGGAGFVCRPHKTVIIARSWGKPGDLKLNRVIRRGSGRPGTGSHNRAELRVRRNLPRHEAASRHSRVKRPGPDNRAS